MYRIARSALLRTVFIAAACHAASAGAQTLTLEDALRIAGQANPALNTAQASRYALEGQLAESRAPLWNNPTANFDPSRRTAPQVGAPNLRYGEWSAGLSQTFEIAGQRGYRLQAATDELAAVDAAIAEVRTQLRFEVEERFVKVLSLQRRILLENENLKLVEAAATSMGKRLAGGEASRLESNIARVEAERTNNQLGLLDEQLIAARAELAELLQLPSERLPEVSGEIARVEAYTREALLDLVAQRPQLAALARRESAARQRLDLERAAATPDVTVGVSIGRDGPYDLRERTVGLSVSVPLPLFRRNEAGIGKAVGELSQALIERQAAERDMRAAVNAQWSRYALLRVRAARLASSVLPPLEENLRLSQAAFRAGEIGLPEVLLVNRQVLEGRRDALEAATELRLAQIALERAAGWTR